MNFIEKNDLLQCLDREYGTPLYVYFEEVILDKIREIFSVFSGYDFNPTFALKANLNPRLLKLISKLGVGADVVSPGELYCTELAGVDISKVIWNGNGKTEEEMNLFLDKRIGIVNIDSFEELKCWSEILKKSCYMPKFFIRINPQVDANTHPLISTGLNRHKFGITIEQVPEFMKLANNYSIQVSGFHTHIGSQITKVEPFLNAFKKLTELSSKYSMNKINIGGGWGINYTGSTLDLSLYQREVLPLLKEYKIYSEFGRYLIGDGGIYLTKVVNVKYNKYSSFVVVNGGMNHLIRPALYSAVHKFNVIGKTNQEKTQFDIVGPLCETGDYLYAGAEGNLPEKDALISFENAGAYGFSMSNNYNGTVRPAEVLVKTDGSYELIRDRENVKDLFNKIIFRDENDS
jgi:diaminopimelate decarboxylase